MLTYVSVNVNVLCALCVFVYEATLHVLLHQVTSITLVETTMTIIVIQFNCSSDDVRTTFTFIFRYNPRVYTNNIIIVIQVIINVYSAGQHINGKT
jgi:hypothetical protein